MEIPSNRYDPPIVAFLVWEFGWRVRYAHMPSVYDLRHIRYALSFLAVVGWLGPSSFGWNRLRRPKADKGWRGRPGAGGRGEQRPVLDREARWQQPVPRSCHGPWSPRQPFRKEPSYIWSPKSGCLRPSLSWGSGFGLWLRPLFGLAYVLRACLRSSSSRFGLPFFS